MSDVSERVLIFAASQKDADHTVSLLTKCGLTGVQCRAFEEFERLYREGCGALILAKEILSPVLVERFTQLLEQQPTWSFLPILLLISAGDFTEKNIEAFRLLKPFKNATYLERPVRLGTLISVVQAVLADRKRQYVLRDLLYELEASRREAIEANRAKSSFLANMSHEIRTPLGVLMGFSELLAEESLTPEERQNYVAKIQRNGRLLSTLIDDILDLSKVEAGKMAIENVPFSLNELLGDVSSDMGLKAREKGIDFSFRALNALPLVVSSDPTRLRQILLNVVGNAVKFTNQGHVELAAGYHQSVLEIRVTDTGPGITPTQAQKLFQPFQQADLSTTRRYGGTGLGLVLTRHLAENMGGSFTLEKSIPGEGSVFVVKIKVGVPQEADAAHPSYQAAFLAPSNDPRDSPRSHLDGMRILVVEDSRDNQSLVKHLLSREGASVALAENGEEGLERALKEDFDAVLMDVQMPVMDGHTATRILRSRGYTKPIIAITAHAMKEEREKCLQSGYSDFLSKPLQKIELVEKLAQIVPHN